MSKSKDESQSTQENKTSSAKQENPLQQAGEKKAKLKQSQQVTNDIKWVPFLIGFHLVTQALNRLSRRPSAPRQEEREDGNKRWPRIPDKTLHVLGNIGMITYQALLFFVYNFPVAIANEGVQVSERALNAGTWIFVAVTLVSLILYFLAANRKSPITSFRNKPGFLALLLAIIFAVSVFPLMLWKSPAEHAWFKLFMGTVCQFLAGCIGWKAANLIPASSSNGGK